ncbi:hypothetical protein D3C86_1470510 [compost metagenome]
MWRKLPATMTFSAQLMNGFGIAFKPLVIFTPHFPAILENSGLAWKTTAFLHFCHLEKTWPLPPNHFPRPGRLRWRSLSFSGVLRVVNGASPSYRTCDERKAFALVRFSTMTNPLVLNGPCPQACPVFRSREICRITVSVIFSVLPPGEKAMGRHLAAWWMAARPASASPLPRCSTGWTSANPARAAS